MSSRSFYCLVVLLIASGSAAAENITAKGVKAGLADCYAQKTAEDPVGVVKKAEWPGAITSTETYKDRALFQIGTRSCWIERSQLEMDLPPPSECAGSGRSHSTRGMGEGGKCQ